MKGLGRSWFSFSPVCLLWQGRRQIPELDEEPVALKSMPRFFGDCFWPAILATANNSLPKLAAEKNAVTAAFDELPVDRPKADFAGLRSLRPFSLSTC
jgi:hypothetical protein